MRKLALCISDNRSGITLLPSAYTLPIDEIILCSIGDGDIEATNFNIKVKNYHFDVCNDISVLKNKFHELSDSDMLLMWDVSYDISDEDIEKLRVLKDSDFQLADVVYFLFSSKFGIAGKPIRTYPRPFIYDKNKYDWRYPVYSRLINNQEVKQIQKYEINVNLVAKEAQIDIDSQVREQFLETSLDDYIVLKYVEELMELGQFQHTSEILERYLSNFIAKHEKRMMVYIERLVNCYLRLNNIGKAQDLVHSYFKDYEKYPRFLLLYADTVSFTDPVNAKVYYMRYIKSLENGLINVNYNYERYSVHPYIMLAEIQNSLGETSKAIDNLMKARSLSRSTVNITKIDQLVNSYYNG
jgi:hypothetical protein